MYGDKDVKRARLRQMAQMVAEAPAGVTQAELAHALGVSRSTVNKDLVCLESKGVCLAEDDAGRLWLPEWKRWRVARPFPFS